MSVILGSGEHRYRVVENWAKLPDGWDLKETSDVEELAYWIACDLTRHLSQRESMAAGRGPWTFEGQCALLMRIDPAWGAKRKNEILPMNKKGKK